MLGYYMSGFNALSKIVNTNPMYTPKRSMVIKNKRRKAHLRRIGKLK